MSIDLRPEPSFGGATAEVVELAGPANSPSLNPSLSLNSNSTPNPRLKSHSSAAFSAVQQAPPTERACQLLVGHAAGRAVDCFLKLAAGTGVEAEVALFEAARVSSERLGQPTRALRLLDDAARRFPQGALRAEAEWLRIQTLERAGKVSEALTASEALLSTSGGHALAPELHAFRGRLFQDSAGDCTRAIGEFIALVGEPGRRGEDAEFRRATCLDRLGRPDAESAYRRYLGRADASHESAVRDRLGQLRDRLGQLRSQNDRSKPDGKAGGRNDDLVEPETAP